MIKQILAKILSNSLLVNIGKLVLVSTVGITTVTTSAYLFDKITLPNDNKENGSTLNLTRSDNENSEQYDTETNSSVSNIEGIDGSNPNVYTSDTIAGASKTIKNPLESFTDSLTTVDVTTSSSKQKPTTTVATNLLKLEDTATGSSKTISSNGTSLVYNNEKDDEDKFEDSEKYENKENRDYDEEDHREVNKKEDDEDHDED